MDFRQVCYIYKVWSSTHWKVSTLCTARFYFYPCTPLSQFPSRIDYSSWTLHCLPSIKMQNDTFLNACTYATCSVEEYGQVSYIPSLAGNAFYLAIFALCLISQVVLGIRYRTWAYMFSMLGGLILETLGYIARVQLHFDVFSQRLFTNTIIGTTIGPAFFSMSIYLCLARIIAIYGSELSPIRPRIITISFVCCDVVSILLQAIGGAITATADTVKHVNDGINISIAGLASQVASMTFFVCLCSYFAWNVRTHPRKTTAEDESLSHSASFRGFLWCKSAFHPWNSPTLPC